MKAEPGAQIARVPTMDVRSAIAVRARRATAPFRRKYVKHGGLVLPASHLRPGGKHFRHDEDFMSSATAEADRLVDVFGINAESSVLDIGCGVGRLPLGLLSRLGEVSCYHGLDVREKAIAWCEQFIVPDHPGCRFTLVDVSNARYNPDGATSAQASSLPIVDRSIDVAYLYSVFSHMLAVDVETYFQELSRVLKPTGHVFLSAFVEDDVPAQSVNPPDYHREWIGDLHCVRLERGYFRGLAEAAGLRIDRIDYATETDGQTGVYLSVTNG